MAKSTGRSAATKAAECKKLETELSVLSRSIKNHPDNDKLYYSKGVTLRKLAEITGNKEKYEEAVTSFNKAIELNGENPYYVIKRAELLVVMDRNQEAFSDLQVATGLAKDLLGKPLGDLSIEEMATVNAIRDVAKLNIQDAEHKTEHTPGTPEQASVVLHLPGEGGNADTAQDEVSAIAGLQVGSSESELPETEGGAVIEIVGAAVNCNICPYCGY